MSCPDCALVINLAGPGLHGARQRGRLDLRVPGSAGGQLLRMPEGAEC